MTTTQDSFEFIKTEVNLRDYIERDETLSPSGHGRHLIAGHDSANGQCMHVSEDLWHCFNCDLGGSIIDYELSRSNGPSESIDACKAIADTMGLQLPQGTGEPMSEEARAAYEQQRAVALGVQELLTSAANFYHHQLTREHRQLLYERGFTDATIVAHRIGWAGEDKRGLLKHLYERCENKETLLATGLFYTGKDGKLYDSFTQRHMLPHWSNKTDVCYFIGRDVTGQAKARYKMQAKKEYVNTDVVRHAIWNLHNVNAKQPVVIVESVLDAQLLMQELPRYCAIAPGTAHLSEEHPKALVETIQKKKPKEIIFCPDTDDNGAGAKGALKGANELYTTLYNDYYEAATKRGDEGKKADKKAKTRMPYITIATLRKPPELDKIDVGDYIADGHTEELHYWLKAGRSLTQYTQWQEDNPRRFFSYEDRRTKFRPKFLADELRNDTYFSYQGEQLYRYGDGVYSPDKGDTPKLMQRKLGAEWGRGHKSETLEYIQECDATYEEQAVNTFIVNMKNGLLDLNLDGEAPILKPHTPYHTGIMQFNAEWDPKANCPAISKFLEDIVHPDDVPLLLELAGYCMLDTAVLHKGFLLIGKGDNGKSTFIKLLETLVHKHNTAAVSLAQLESDKYATADLYGKAANMNPDMNVGYLTGSEKFKNITAGDTIRGERKFKDSFTFVPTATRIVSMNEMPRSRDITTGMIRRLCFIEFPNSFPKEGEEPIKQNVLVPRLTTSEELNGFATLSLMLIREAILRGALTNSTQGAALVKEFKESFEPALDFIQAHLKPTGGHNQSTSEVFSTYREWLEQNFPNHKPRDAKAFSKLVSDVYPDIEKARKRIGGRQTVAYIDFRLDWENGEDDNTLEVTL